MKKSTKLMALLAALCLVTSSFVGSTLAKYITSAEADSSARVAKFGVVVTAEVDPFLAEYEADVEAKDADNELIANTVVAYNGKDLLVAPGTEGDLGATTITGQPEVAVNVKKVATLTLTNWEVDVTDDEEDNAVYYCPIIITVNDTEFDGTDYESAADFIEAVEAAIEADVNYPANTELNTTDDVEITWEWGFSEVAEGQTDVKDTALGDAAAAGTPATIALELTTTVTQID